MALEEIGFKVMGLDFIQKASHLSDTLYVL